MIAKSGNQFCNRSDDGIHVFNDRDVCSYCGIGKFRVEPVHRIGVSFIAAVPDGAKLMAFNEQIFLVAPGMAPCFVTPTGLVPVQQADGSDLK